MCTQSFRDSKSTYKVILDSQPLGAILMQQALQQFTTSIGYIGLQHQGLVQDVIVHLSSVAAVKGRLEEKE